MAEKTILSSFVLEFREQVAKRNVLQYQNTVKSMTEGVLNTVTTVINPKVYMDYLQKAVDNLNSITENTEVMDAFFTKVYKSAVIADKKITLPFQPDDKVEKFRYAYLETVIRDFQKAVQDVLAGKKNQVQIQAKFANGDYVTKMKKQLVKSDYVAVDVRDLMKMDSPSLVPITNVFIQNNVIPFVRNYNANVSNITAIAMNSSAYIRDCMGKMDSIVTSIDEMKSNGSLDPKVSVTLDYTVINFTSNFLDLAAYLCGTIIRKISYYTFNMTSVTTLYNTLLGFFPEGELVLHESVMNGDLSDIDDSDLLRSIFDKDDLNILIPHIRSNVNRKKMEISNIVAKKFNKKINFDEEIDSTEYPFDKSKYIGIWNVLKDISRAVDLYAENVKDEEQIPDEIITNSGLEETFVTKYADQMNRFDDVSYYISQSSVVDPLVISMCLFNEISHFEEVAEKLAHNLNVIYGKIKAEQNIFEINSMNMEDNRFKELQSFTDTLMTRYKDFALQVVKKLIHRLDNLTDILSDIDLDDDVATPEPYVPYEDTLKEFTEAYDAILANEEKEIVEANKQYYAYMKEKTEGVKVVFEEVQPAQGANEGATGGNQKKPSTAAKVTNDPEATQKMNDVGNEGNTTETNETKATATGKATVESFIQRIKDIIAKFFDKLKENDPDKFKKEMDAAAELINEYGEQKVTEMLPYTFANRDTILGEINGAATRVRSIDPKNVGRLLGNTKNQAMNYLFNKVGQKMNGGAINSADGAKLTEMIKNFHKGGTIHEIGATKYTGKDSVKKLKECKNFFDNYQTSLNEIKAAVDNLTNVVAEKEQQIINEPNNDQSANAQNAKHINYSTILTSVTSAFINGALYAYDARYTDCIKVLQAFKNSVQPPKKNNEENQQ